MNRVLATLRRELRLEDECLIMLARLLCLPDEHFFIRRRFDVRAGVGGKQNQTTTWADPIRDIAGLECGARGTWRCFEAGVKTRDCG
jgi:hypothetical protein